MIPWISAADAVARNRARRPRLVVSGSASPERAGTAQALARLTGLPWLAPASCGRSARPEHELALVLGACVQRAAQEQLAVHGFIAEGGNGFDCLRAIGSRGRVLTAAHTRLFGRPRVEAALMHLCTAQARLAYEGVIHVPQEPGPGLDWRGVRAVHQAERAWIGLYQDLRLPYRVIRGSLEERLQQALDHFRLYPVMALAQAVELTQGEPGR